MKNTEKTLGRRRRVVSFAAGVLGASLLASCSSSSTWGPAQAPPRDEAVAALLPKGAFTFTATTQNIVENSQPELRSTIEGYVDFGVTGDGTDCAVDYTVTDYRTVNGESKERSVRYVRRPGETTWVQETGRDAESLEWFDGADLRAPFPGALVLFVPAGIRGSTAGSPVDGVCRIMQLPLYASLMDDALVLDRDRLHAADKAGNGRWIEAYIDAAGFTGKDRDEVATLMEQSGFPGGLPWADEYLEAGNLHMSIDTRADGGFTLTQKLQPDREDGTVAEQVHEFVFVPSPERTVDQVSGLTFRERIEKEKDDKGAKSFRQEILDTVRQGARDE